MASGNTGTKSARAEETRERILSAAERLFAEHGVFAVSNRQVSEAAGQGNNAAVGYHFGTKTDLVRAIVHKHGVGIEQHRARLLREAGDSPEVRDWIACLIQPPIDHLASLGSPTWYARFSAQVLTDPTLRDIVYNDSLTSPSLQETLRGIGSRLPELPAEVRWFRADMARQLSVHMTAERERRLVDALDDESLGWDDFSADLLDAIVGMWLAPSSRGTG
ncbi:TetR/AcrR family transcriptional regulator [Williamsia muralis]|uniref:TetR family transcriptional regulator n=1 Tax=Williamsia marianensis TaxID=85044 RepID=A0A2G3PMN2_WILMA|nr:TetR family transcriptional regulator [Williamsia marianensis]PHV66993.1 TetR family transcriptional regulator [Williamsia marianensis]